MMSIGIATRTIITSFGRTNKDNSTITGNATTNINTSNSITFTATLKDSFGNNITAIASSFTFIRYYKRWYYYSDRY